MLRTALVWSAVSIPAGAQPEIEALQPDRELTYKSIGEVDLSLHVFEPQGLASSDRRPAVVFFFGGGWVGGTPRQFYQQSRYLADRGMVAFAAEYRIKSHHGTSPYECVKDGKSAIRWVRQHAAELGVDPDRIVASGGSAGGHVAACTGVIQGFEEAGEDTASSSIPNAMILFNPVIDTTDKGFGGNRFKADRRTELSPAHHVRPGLPPTLLFHGTADTTTPFENAERFARLMSKAGNTCALAPFEGRKHGFFNGTHFRPKSDGSDYKTTMAESVRFLEALGYLPVKGTRITGGI